MSPFHRGFPARLLGLALCVALGASACLGGSTPSGNQPDPTHYFETLPPGSSLPSGEVCADKVLADPSTEVRPENEQRNTTLVEATVAKIDGADAFWNERLAPRVTGDFTGTTEQILRWGSCKWGFDENVTRARAVTESTWFATTEGDTTEDADECGVLGLDAPCAQSYGLLQVKGTVHDGTFPYASQSSAFGVDYAMAWLRACYEGSFDWLDEQGYEAGDEFGCVGAWFSGEWWDQPANDYAGEVRYHVQNKTWQNF